MDNLICIVVVYNITISNDKKLTRITKHKMPIQEIRKDYIKYRTFNDQCAGAVWYTNWSLGIRLQTGSRA